MATQSYLSFDFNNFTEDGLKDITKEFKRKTIGIQVPQCAIVDALLAELGAPIMSSTLILPGEELPMTDPYDIRTTLEYHVDLVIDGGYRGMEATTVVSLLEDTPQVLRVGKGDPTPFQTS